MKHEYCKINFHGSSLKLIEIANTVLDEYSEEGYELTLRQLYYQFIARDIFPEDRRWSRRGGKWVKDPNGTKNAEPNYKWLGSIISNGRLCGLVDWNSIIDRTRKFQINSHWDTPAEIIEDAARWYQRDSRETQDNYVEVWVEKDALIGIVEQTCDPLDVGYFSCRGFVSQSAMWKAALRLKRQEEIWGKTTTILHLGDLDPSGIDMTRDIKDRLEMFGSKVHVNRIALEMFQVRKYGPPPNYAKATDSRYKTYRDEYGEQCWELDALEPQVIEDLITKHVKDLTIQSRRTKIIKQQEDEREQIEIVPINWDAIMDHFD
jgi:hypothetical protein